MDIVNIGIISDGSTRVVFGNIEDTNDLYIMRQNLKRVNINLGLGKMEWTTERDIKIPNVIRDVKRYYKEENGDKAWDFAYVNFIKYNIRCSDHNFNMFLPFTAGFKNFFEINIIPRGVNLYLKETDSYPFKIMKFNKEQGYIVKNMDYEEDILEIQEDYLHEIAFKNWQVRRLKL